MSTPQPPPARDESPVAFVFSDVTMSEVGDDKEVESPRTSSLLEYSDSNSEDFSRRRRNSNGSRRRSHDLFSKSRFRGLRNEASSSDRSLRVVRFSNDEDEDRKEKDEENPPGNSPRNRPSKKQGTISTPQPAFWKRWAYSFRSPAVSDSKHHARHARADSNVMLEYPHYISIGNNQAQREERSDSSSMPPPPPIDLAPSRENSFREDSPLLGAAYSLTPTSFDTKTEKTPDNREQAVLVAAAFLQDCEANRPATFASANLQEISSRQVTLYHLLHSRVFLGFKVAATFSFFISSFLEGFEEGPAFRGFLLTGLNLFAISVVVADMSMHFEIRSSGPKHNRQRRAAENLTPYSRRVRTSRSEKLVKPVILFCIVLGLENLSRLLVTRDNGFLMFSSIFKPLILFYVSSQARDALAAVRRIIPIVVRVLVMEMLLILMFAAVACRLFHEYESFQDLKTAWLSLFKLSTAVVNPSIWMPMYQASKFSAFFFVFFIVTAVFYLHSLVLSVVFQTYIQAAAEIHERSSADREGAVQLAYMALQQPSTSPGVIDVQLVRKTLQVIRPHYSAMKINALVEIVNPSNQSTVDYPTFRTKIRQALNASIRTARNASPLAMSIELVAVFVAIANFVYVILVSSPFNESWFNAIQVQVGIFITVLAAFELLIRFNPLRIPDFTPLTRLNATFDGSALVASVISCIGIVLFILGRPTALEYVLTGRAIDMIRIMRFFQIFRDIARRSSDVIPALAGPVVLVVTTLHIFVYLGMAFWGGAITVGQYGHKITFLYELNNFNSYQEGVVSMFQILVVNDWHLIAEVFLQASRCSSPFIVYPFFVSANLIAVSIMLNVLTAFFVESFVTKLNDDKDAPAEATATIHKQADFSTKPVRHISSTNNLARGFNDEDDHGADADSEGSSDSELFEFDVYEREGFDKIMQTVSGVDYHGDMARNICNYLEIFESLSPGRESVGYLVCDQQSLERFGNRRFQNKAEDFLDENRLHGLVSDMHSELLALASRASFQNRSLLRTIPHRDDPGKVLEISASLLRRQPVLSLFVSRIVKRDAGSTPVL